MAFFTKRNAAKFGRQGGIAARAVSGKRTGRKAAGKQKRSAASYRGGDGARYKSGIATDRKYGQRIKGY